ncbi:NAD(P)-binding protein [Rhizopogon vinicolor AM-OR11-026]|uniref:NAD(P)-binding protein n=1 Tax=Rhizopogon vinicolor AM-OR11-026 TaxID=1314800 RepID=A0A1B7MS13_9AGAM|nr:NAD(P)-binding protein [Rhizopogon vinicolor AM-OR11-026]
MISDPNVWLITGTSTGFGRRLVSLVLERGDRVIATARSVQRIQDIPQSPNLHLLELDVDSGTDVIKQRVNEAAKVWGRIDVLVNNAGIGWPGLLEECGTELMMKQFRTNFFGVLDVTNAALPYMRERRSGTIVIIGSRSAWRPELKVIHRPSTKNTTAMGETLAVEVAPFNIRVLIVEPGAFRTENIYINKFDTWTNPIPDYDDIRASANAMWGSIHGKQPGDPVKAMKIIVDVVKGEGVAVGREWPLYLILGEDAERDVRNKCAKILGHLDEWQDVIRDVNL